MQSEEKGKDQIFQTQDKYLDNLGKETKLLQDRKIQDLLKHFQTRFWIAGIPYLIHLHRHNLLSEAISLGLKELDKNIVHPQFKKLHSQIYSVFPEFLSHIANCKIEYANLLQNENYKALDVKIKQITDKEKQRFKKWQGLMIQFLKLKNMKIFNIHDFNNFVKNILLPFQISTQIQDAMCMNWLRGQLELLRDNEKNICCKLIFYDQMTIKAPQDKNTEFKKYFWPVTSPNIEYHLRKTIVGFLNTGGGIIYIGIQQSKQKSTLVSGIELKKNQLGNVYTFFSELIDKNIYPKHKGFQIQNKNAIIIEGKQIEINSYINIEFMPVVNEKNYLPIENKYIMKLFVKIGHQKHFYHLINNENMIDFFVRDDRNVEKKAFPDAYNIIYDKLNKFEKYKEDNRNKEPDQPKNEDNLQRRETFHNDCRYIMANVCIDIDIDSDDDDSD